MSEHILTQELICYFSKALLREERAPGTVENYLRSLTGFARWLNGRAVNREIVLQWKGHLLASGLMPATVNSKPATLNSLFRCLGWEDC